MSETGRQNFCHTTAGIPVKVQYLHKTTQVGNISFALHDRALTESSSLAEAKSPQGTTRC